MTLMMTLEFKWSQHPISSLQMPLPFCFYQLFFAVLIDSLLCQPKHVLLEIQYAEKSRGAFTTGSRKTGRRKLKHQQAGGEQEEYGEARTLKAVRWCHPLN